MHKDWPVPVGESPPQQQNRLDSVLEGMKPEGPFRSPAYREAMTEKVRSNAVFHWSHGIGLISTLHIPSNFSEISVISGTP